MKSWFAKFWILAGCTAAFSLAQETTTNPDGTKTTTYTVHDETKKQQSQTYDPYKRTSTDSVQDPRLRSKQTTPLFPEEEEKKRQKAIEDAKKTSAQQEQEKKMLDKTPVLTTNFISPTLKQRQSIPKRF